MGTPTSGRESPAENVAAGIVFDRYLLSILPDEDLRFDLDLFRATRVRDLPRDVGWDSVFIQAGNELQLDLSTSNLCH